MNKMKTLALSVIGLALAAAAFAHGANHHQLLGTIKDLHEDHLIVTDQHHVDHGVELTDKTTFEKSGKPATRADIKAGTRVSIHLSEDGKVAEQVKIGTEDAGSMHHH